MLTPSDRFRIEAKFGIFYAVIDLVRDAGHWALHADDATPLYSVIAALSAVLLLAGAAGAIRRRPWAPQACLGGLAVGIVQGAMALQFALERGPEPSPFRIALVTVLVLGATFFLGRDAWAARNAGGGTASMAVERP